MVSQDTQRSRQSGVAAVEFALSATFLVMTMLFMWEMVLMVYTYNVMAVAAKEGVRYAVMHGTGNTAICVSPCTGNQTTNTAAVRSVVQNFASNSFHDVSGMTVTVNYPDGSAAPPNRVQVLISYPYKPLIVLPWMSPVIAAASEGRIQN